MKWLIRFLPVEYKAYFILAERMLSHLDTQAERRDAMTYFVESLQSEGYMSVPEWAAFGKKIGMLGKSKS